MKQFVVVGGLGDLPDVVDVLWTDPALIEKPTPHRLHAPGESELPKAFPNKLGIVAQVSERLSPTCSSGSQMLIGQFADLILCDEADDVRVPGFPKHDV